MWPAERKQLFYLLSLINGVSGRSSIFFQNLHFLSEKWASPHTWFMTRHSYAHRNIVVLSSHKREPGLAGSFWAAVVTRWYLLEDMFEVHKVLCVNLSFSETSGNGFIPEHALEFMGDAEINYFCLQGTYNEVRELRPSIAT